MPIRPTTAKFESVGLQKLELCATHCMKPGQTDDDSLTSMLGAVNHAHVHLRAHTLQFGSYFIPHWGKGITECAPRSIKLQGIIQKKYIAYLSIQHMGYRLFRGKMCWY